MSKSNKPVLEQIHMANLTLVHIQIRAILLGDQPEKPKEGISRPGARELEYHFSFLILI